MRSRRLRDKSSLSVAGVFVLFVFVCLFCFSLGGCISSRDDVVEFPELHLSVSTLIQSSQMGKQQPAGVYLFNRLHLNEESSWLPFQIFEF